MKKRMALVLATALLLALTACGGESPSSSEANESTTSSAVTSSTPEATSSAPEATSSEAETASTPEASEAERPVASTDLSTEWDSFQFELNGALYTFPATYAEFEANGWGPGKGVDLGDTLTRNQYTVSFVTLLHGDNEVTVQFSNLGDEEAAMRDCHVTAVQLSDLHSGNTTLIFPGNIALGSTQDDVQSQYGEPKEKKESSATTDWKYQTEIYDDVILTFDNETNKITKLRMSNMYLPE